jgi:hypothetical protein
VRSLPPASDHDNSSARNDFYHGTRDHFDDRSARYNFDNGPTLDHDHGSRWATGVHRLNLLSTRPLAARKRLGRLLASSTGSWRDAGCIGNLKGQDQKVFASAGKEALISKIKGVALSLEGVIKVFEGTIAATPRQLARWAA